MVHTARYSKVIYPVITTHWLCIQTGPLLCWILCCSRGFRACLLWMEFQGVYWHWSWQIMIPREQNRMRQLFMYHKHWRISRHSDSVQSPKSQAFSTSPVTWRLTESQMTEAFDCPQDSCHISRKGDYILGTPRLSNCITVCQRETHTLCCKDWKSPWNNSVVKEEVSYNFKLETLNMCSGSCCAFRWFYSPSISQYKAH